MYCLLMKIFIYGLGLVGGSVAKKLLTIPGYKVYGFDSNSQTTSKAEAEGVKIIKKPDKSFDLVIIAVSPEKINI